MLLWIFWYVSFGEHIHTYSSLAGVDLLGCRVCVLVDTINRCQSVRTNLNSHQKCRRISRFCHPWNASPICPIIDVWNVAIRGVSLAGRAHALLTSHLYWVSHSGNWEILTRVKINAGKHCALNGRKETRDSRKIHESASCPCTSAVALKCLSGHQVYAWPQQSSCENHTFDICPKGFAPSLSRGLVSLVPWGGRERSVGVPMPPEAVESPICAAPQFPLLLWTGPQPHSLCSLPQPPNWPPSLLFSKTGIILHIFFPSPKIGKRREQLIWSSCWFCYLKIFFYSNSLSGFPSHLHTLLHPLTAPPPPYTAFTKPPSLESRECFFLSCL